MILHWLIYPWKLNGSFLGAKKKEEKFIYFIIESYHVNKMDRMNMFKKINSLDQGIFFSFFHFLFFWFFVVEGVVFLYMRAEE